MSGLLNKLECGGRGTSNTQYERQLSLITKRSTGTRTHRPFIIVVLSAQASAVHATNASQPKEVSRVAAHEQIQIRVNDFVSINHRDVDLAGYRSAGIRQEFG
jgi:hypothetical protein